MADQNASGWKKGIGGTLITIAGLGAAGQDYKASSGGDWKYGLLGSAILGGLGTYLIASDKKRKKGKGLMSSLIRGQYNRKGQGIGYGYEGGCQGGEGLQQHIYASIHKLLKSSKLHGRGIQFGRGTNRLKAIAYIKANDRPMHIKDMFGSKWKSKGKKLISLFEKAALRAHPHHFNRGSRISRGRGQEGGSVFSAIGKWTKKAVHSAVKKIRDFGMGRTKFKPSQFMKIGGTILAIEGTALSFLGIPGASVVGAVAKKGLNKYGDYLKKTGRGVNLPKHVQNFIKNNPEGFSKMKQLLNRPGSGYGSGYDDYGSGIGETFSTLAKLYRGFSKAFSWIQNSGLSWQDVRDAAHSSHMRAEYGRGLQGLEHTMIQAAKSVDSLSGGLGQLHTMGHIGKMPAEYVPAAAQRLIQTLADNSEYNMSKSGLAAAIGVATASAVAAGAYALYKRLRNKKGSGLRLAGQGCGQGSGCGSGYDDSIGSGIGSGLAVAGGSRLSSVIKQYMKENPEITERLAHMAKNPPQLGAGIASKTAKLGAILGLTGTAAAAGAYGMLEYLKANPAFATKIAAKGVWSLLSGQGFKSIKSHAKNRLSQYPRPIPINRPINVKGGFFLQPDQKIGNVKVKRRTHAEGKLPFGISLTQAGKIKKDRYSVFHGYHNKTSGGLTKSDFMLKGRKVISKKKHARGLALKSGRKGLFK